MSGLGQLCVIINPPWFQVILLETHSYVLSVAFAPEFSLRSSSKTGYTVHNLTPSVFCSFPNLGIAWWNLSERSSSFCHFLKWPSSLSCYLLGLSIKNQLSKESLDIIISLLKHFHFSKPAPVSILFFSLCFLSGHTCLYQVRPSWCFIAYLFKMLVYPTREILGDINWFIHFLNYSVRPMTNAQ